MHKSVANVKVAVVGDLATGKTCLISTACKGVFESRTLPPVLPPARLPPDFTSAQVPMVVTDTSSRPEDQAVVDLVLQTSDVIIVCFDATRQSTLDSIRSSWYPRMQRLNSDAPVVLACCKADLLRGDTDILHLRERVEAAVQDLPSIEVCLNVSARQQRNVGAIFEYALKGVLYPLQPLYDRFDKRLKLLCVRALKRVFMMCDADGDGALNDVELNTFQLVCYGAALSEDELQNVKQVVASKMPAGVTPAGVTLDGFLFLHVLFIERGCLESIWAVLRKFGYNDQLRLHDEVLDAHVNFHLPPDQVYELSELAEQFLCTKFCAYDVDGDGLLSWQQLDAMFSTIPPPMWQGEEWSRLLVPGVYGATHHLEAFLLKWRYSVLQCPRTALSHLLYMGAGGPDGSGASLLLQPRARRKADKKHRAELAARSSLHCYVFGSQGAGKSTLIHALPGLRPSPSDLIPPTLATHSSTSNTHTPSTANGAPSQSREQAHATVGAPAGSKSRSRAQQAALVAEDVRDTRRGSGPFAAVAPVHGPTGGRERTLVMQEISEDIEQQLITAAAMAKDYGSPLLIIPPSDSLDSKGTLDLTKADVAAFVFDASSTESFRAAVNLMVQVSALAGDTLPCVLVATKEDLVMGAQLEKELAEVMADLQVRGPVRCSALLGELGGVFGTLALAAISPEGWVPETPDRKARKQLVQQVATVACVCGVTIVGGAALYAMYRLLHSSSTTSSRSASTASSNQPTSGSRSSSMFGSSSNNNNSSSGGGGDRRSSVSYENDGLSVSSLVEHASNLASRLPSFFSGLLSAEASSSESSSKPQHAVSSVRAHSVAERRTSSSSGASQLPSCSSLAQQCVRPSEAISKRAGSEWGSRTTFRCASKAASLLPYVRAHSVSEAHTRGSSMCNSSCRMSGAGCGVNTLSSLEDAGYGGSEGTSTSEEGCGQGVCSVSDGLRVLCSTTGHASNYQSLFSLGLSGATMLCGSAAALSYRPRLPCRSTHIQCPSTPSTTSLHLPLTSCSSTQRHPACLSQPAGLRTHTLRDSSSNAPTCSTSNRGMLVSSCLEASAAMSSAPCFLAVAELLWVASALGRLGLLHARRNGYWSENRCECA